MRGVPVGPRLVGAGRQFCCGRFASRGALRSLLTPLDLLASARHGRTARRSRSVTADCTARAVAPGPVEPANGRPKAKKGIADLHI